MPIQFQCPHCRHAMQLPDAAAGKQGKCPNCSNAVTVPAPQAAAPLNPHDAEFWSELDGKKEVVHDEHEAPKHVKKTDAQLLKYMLGKVEAAKVVKRIGTPWERPKEGRMFDRFWDTAIGVMNHSTDTFNEMRVTGGIGSPFRFLIIGVLLGSLMLAVYSTVAVAIVVVPAARAVNVPPPEGEFDEADTEAVEAATGAVVTVALILTLIMAFSIVFFGVTIVAFIHVFLQAGGLQLALPMVGVKEATFEKSFRVVAFTNGSIYLCNIVPGLGLGFMLGLWFNSLIKGLESVYQIPNKKAVLAVLLLFVPLVLPIVALVGFFMLVQLGYL